uniref:Uncharacterized protein n=1 Tax=Globodera rostochiensis TaxID=31243 RepID=A0A914I7C7_GLORO
MAALLNIRFRHLPVHPEAIRMPIVFPLLFLAFCLTLVTVTVAQSFSTSVVGLAMLAMALCLYTGMLRKRTPLRRFAPYRRCIEAIDDGFAVMAQIVFDGQIRLNSDNKQNAAEDLKE